MIWHIASQRHQQSWYWSCYSFTKEKKHIYFHVSKNNIHHERHLVKLCSQDSCYIHIYHPHTTSDTCLEQHLRIYLQKKSSGISINVSTVTTKATASSKHYKPNLWLNNDITRLAFHAMLSLCCLRRYMILSDRMYGCTWQVATVVLQGSFWVWLGQ